MGGATQDFTDDQRKAMLKGTLEREGKWDSVNIKAELETMGRDAGLKGARSAQLFKTLVDEQCIDTGRILQAGERVENTEPNGEAVDYVGMLIHISYNMKLTDKGRAELNG